MTSKDSLSVASEPYNVNNQIEGNLKMESDVELETPFVSSQLLGQFNIQQNGEKECYISGICLMPTGTILLTDVMNKTLKHVDSSYVVVDLCKLSGQPDSICSTGPSEVALILSRLKTIIQFVSVTSTLTLTKSFVVNENCRGITYSQGQLFVSCGGRTEFNEGPGTVRVYSTDGKLLHNLPQKSADHRVWSCPVNVVVSTDGNKVIVIDLKHGVVTMNRDGSNLTKKELWVNNPSEQNQSLWFAGGVPGAKEIHQINADWASLGPLLTEETGLDAEPTAIGFQRDSNRLILGFKNCNYIKVFQLQRQ